MAQLCTQTDVETVLQIDFGNDNEPVATWLIEKASAKVEAWCRRAFAQDAAKVETFDGRGTRTIRVALTPINSIGSIVEDGTALTEGDDFLWYPDGRITRMFGDHQGRWSWKRQAVVVTYDGGYATIPDLVIGVTAEIAARGFQAGAAFAAGGGPVKTEKIDDYSITWAPQAYDLAAAAMGLTDDDKMTLGTFRRRM